MKKLYNKAILAGFIIMMCLLAFACGDVYLPFEIPGNGNVIVSFSAGRAALSPADMDFDEYEFTFKRGGETVDAFVEKKAASYIFTLPVGNGYTLEVEAYVRDASSGEQVTAARGSSVSSFDVGTAPTTVTVKLSGVLDGKGIGTFSYSIKYPEDADIEMLELLDENDVSTDLLNGAVSSGGVTSGSIDVESGWHFLFVRLRKEDGSTTGYFNGVVIIPGQTTYYGTEDEPYEFTDDDFEAPPPENTGVRVYEWHGFNIEGASHYFNNDRTSDEFDEKLYDWDTYPAGAASNYDRSRAVGYVYDNIIGPNGTVVSDVLKISPPVNKDPQHYRDGVIKYENGYEDWTLTMTRQVVTPGFYKLTMWYMITGGNEEATFYWANTGGEDGDVYFGTGVPYTPWRDVLGAMTVPVSRDVWHYAEGNDFYIFGNDEIGLMARSVGDGGGLRDATIYIYDIKFERVIDSGDQEQSITLAYPGGFQQIFVDASVDWISMNSNIASVDNNGIITAAGMGETTVKAVLPEDGSVVMEIDIRVINKPTSGGKYIALTYDDGPEPEWTPQFIKIFNRYNARATFFPMGKKINISEERKEILASLARAGHEIGNHTYYHWEQPNYYPTVQKSIEDIKTELNMASDLIEEVTGARPKVFRAPTLRYEYDIRPEYPPAGMQFGDRLEEACRELGMPIIDTTGHHDGDFDWDSSRRDNDVTFPGGRQRSPQEMAERHLSLAKNWGILLSHDGNLINVSNNAKAIPIIIEALYEQGYQLVTISEMAEISKASRGTPDLEPGRIYYDLEQIPEHVTGITINCSADTVEVGSTQTLTASLTGGQQQVFWYSENKAVAVIDELTGVLTALSPGTAVIRAAAGGMRNFITITVVSAIGPKPEITPITSWYDEAIDIPGSYGDVNFYNDRYFGSQANWTVLDELKHGNLFIFNNVLELTPPASWDGGGNYDGGYYYNYMEGGSLAVNYTVPYSGYYTLSVDALIDSDGLVIPSGALGLAYTWFMVSNETNFNNFINVPRNEIKTDDWMKNESSVYLNAGTRIGLYMRNKGNAEGLFNAKVYIKNLKLVLEHEGEKYTVIDIPSSSSVDIVPATSWDVFNVAGAEGYSAANDYYKSSGALGDIINNYQPGDGYSYSNVMKMYPPENGYDLWGAVAMSYEVPYDGNYAVSMKVKVVPKNDPVDIAWYEWSTWGPFLRENNLNPEEIYHLSGILTSQETGAKLQIAAGTKIGLLTSLFRGNTVEGVRDGTIYIWDFKLDLEYEGQYYPVINISSPATLLPQIENPGITLQWEDGGIELAASVSEGDIVSQNPLTIRRGGTVTITPQGSFNSYEWIINRETVGSGNAYTFTGTEAGTHKILLWVNGREKGASISVTVE